MSALHPLKKISPVAMAPSAPWSIHLCLIAGIILIAGLAYLPLMQSNYCGFDDTLELQRLKFYDPGTLAGDFGPMPFQQYESYKYRPLFWTLNRITYRLGHGDATAFRVRNVAAHLLSIGLVYGIALLLFHSIAISASAALLFSLHPLANQAVAGAVWISTQAFFLAFLAFFLFLISLRARRWSIPALIGSLLAVAVSVLIYDPLISVFGFIYLYLFVHGVIRRQQVSVAYYAVLGIVTVGFLSCWFWLRHVSLPPGRIAMVSPRMMLEGLAIFVGGIFQVIDPILAADVVGTPLPREALAGEIPPEWVLIVLLPGTLLVAALTIFGARLRANLTREDMITFGFVLLAWCGSLVPYLVFSGHASESYTYVGWTLVTPSMCRLLAALTTKPGAVGVTRPFMWCVALLAVLFGVATVNRNLRVQQCGSILGNVLRQLPLGELRRRNWHVLFANVPGDPASRPYGMYGYKGVDTLGYGGYGAPGVKAAVQVAASNPGISADAVSAEEFARRCSEPAAENTLCVWVHWTGDLVLVPRGAPVTPPAPYASTHVSGIGRYR